MQRSRRASGALTDYDGGFLRKAVADKVVKFGYIEVQDVTTQFGGFAIFGPKSCKTLTKIIVDADPEMVFSNKRFPWLGAAPPD